MDVSLIEKRIRRHIRTSNFFEKGDRILATDDITEFLLKKILGKLPDEIIKKKISLTSLSNKTAKEFIKKNKINKVVIPWTADDESVSFLKSIFGDGNISFENTSYIKLLRPVLDEEASFYAKKNKIQWQPNKKDKKVKTFIDNMQKKYPETKFSLIRSIEKLEEILR